MNFISYFLSVVRHKNFAEPAPGTILFRDLLRQLYPRGGRKQPQIQKKLSIRSALVTAISGPYSLGFIAIQLKSGPLRRPPRSDEKYSTVL
jgi:hypothetical protein